MKDAPFTAGHLLALYDRAAEAEDAIPRLRRFVLDLAVCGKLVEQDPTNEPAAELLKRIAKEKARLVKAGEVKREKPLPPLTDADMSYDLPEGWGWVRLGNLSQVVTSGSRDWAKHYAAEGAIFVRMGNLSKDHYRLRLDSIQRVRAPADGEGTRTRLAAGDILISITGDVGMLGLIPEGFGEAYINQHTAMVRPMPEMRGRYLAELFRSPFAQTQFGGPQRGIKNSFRLTDITQFVVPLPPLAEQQRIVAKVDELMALCDRLQAARAGREAVRDRLTAATLARLTAPETDAEAFPTPSFQTNARFALQTLPTLTTRAGQIKTLRQTILNLAVRGKLVAQDPTDEPAAELLKRIGKKRAALVAAGIAKKEKLAENEAAPFTLPDSWSWCGLGQLCQLITKGSSPKWQGVSYVAGDSGLMFITSENVGNFTLRKLGDLKYVESRFRDIEPRSMLKKGDILVNLVGASIGRTAIFDLDAEANINQAVALVRLVDLTLGPSFDYLLMYLNSDTAVDQMLGSRVITAQPNISLADVNGFPIPLPPLAEQHRIVARVDALMALCDQMEASLTTTTTTRSRLLESLLHEALSGALGGLPEAAA